MSEEIQEKPKKARKKKDLSTVAAAYPNQIRLRDENGLLPNINYIKDELGFVDWRQMINEQHVVLNKMAYAHEGIDVLALEEEEVNKIKAEAPENKKLIKLGGFKQVARLRGIQSQKFDLVHRGEGMAAVSCRIDFVPNYENPTGLTVEAIAQASLENVTPNSEYAKYLEVIASNRAFIRAVKEGLQILTLSEDEIKLEDVPIKAAKPGTPRYLLETTCAQYNLKIDDLIKLLVDSGVEVKEEWVSLDTLPTSVIATLIPKIKKQTKENKKDDMQLNTVSTT